MVVDAFCPECREDLSEAPESPPAGNTAKPGSPNGHVLESLRSWFYVAIAGGSAIVAATTGEWTAAITMGLVAVLIAALTIWLDHPPSVKTSVTGREKTRKNPE
jgi:hypothetical protein